MSEKARELEPLVSSRKKHEQRCRNNLGACLKDLDKDFRISKLLTAHFARMWRVHGRYSIEGSALSHRLCRVKLQAVPAWRSTGEYRGVRGNVAAFVDREI